MGRAKLIELPVNGGSDGVLTVVEGNSTIPFDIKRCFYIYNVMGNSVRGNHANRNSEMFMIAVSGSARVRVKDGHNVQEFFLNTPECGLYLPKMTWKEMWDFSSDCVLLILASEHYDKNEYIVDFREFKKEVSK